MNVRRIPNQSGATLNCAIAATATAHAISVAIARATVAIVILRYSEGSGLKRKGRFES